MQPSNIDIIKITFEVSKLERLIDVNEEQPENINSILVAFEVSKLGRLIDFNEEQPENIESILFIYGMSRYGLNEIEIILLIPWKIELKFSNILNSINISWLFESLNE